jgi:hypothetical protein
VGRKAILKEKIGLDLEVEQKLTLRVGRRECVSVRGQIP